MLTALRIENVAIVESLEVQFSSGLNVLTGETGAGKSILVDALHLALGGRASGDVIRTGAEEACVEALFEGPGLAEKLAALGLPVEGDQLLVRRIVSRSGRSRAWVNGAIATVSLLEQVCKGLVDISGQHEHVSLLDTALHLALLDGYAGLEPEVQRYRHAYDAWLSAQRERDGLLMDEQERARRADYLAFQLDEIEKLDPKPGEDADLAQSRKKLASGEKLRTGAEEAERLLYSGEGSAVETVGQAFGRINELAVIDPSLGPVQASLKTALAELEESARTLGSYARSVEGDPEELERVEERLEGLRRLCRKHGGDLASVLARRDEMKSQLANLTNHGARLEELAKEVGEKGRVALALGEALSEKRRKAAKEFSKAVAVELKDLAMAKTAFEVQLRRAAAEGNVPVAADGGVFEGAMLTPRGIDTCELLLSPNAGEELKPLAKIASGGELSRVMLAIKRALARTDPVPTYVFDEVDTGIGGAVAEVVGRLLKEVAGERQVLCITHLPQIAAFGDQHLVVEKQVKAGRTCSRVSPVEGGARTRELARMLAGVEVTPGALKNAEEMIEAAHRGERRIPAAARRGRAEQPRSRRVAARS